MAYLTFLAPLLRGWSRMSWRWRLRPTLRSPAYGRWSWRGLAASGEFVSAETIDKPQLLAAALQAFRAEGLAVAETAEWRSHDLAIFQDPLVRHTVVVATEQPDSQHRLHRLRVTARPTPVGTASITLVAIACAVLLMAGQPFAALLLLLGCFATTVWVLGQARATARRLMGLLLHTGERLATVDPGEEAL